MVQRWDYWLFHSICLISCITFILSLSVTSGRYLCLSKTSASFSASYWSLLTFTTSIRWLFSLNAIKRLQSMAKVLLTFTALFTLCVAGRRTNGDLFSRAAYCKVTAWIQSNITHLLLFVCVCLHCQPACSLDVLQYYSYVYNTTSCNTAQLLPAEFT